MPRIWINPWTRISQLLFSTILIFPRRSRSSRKRKRRRAAAAAKAADKIYRIKNKILRAKLTFHLRVMTMIASRWVTATCSHSTFIGVSRATILRVLICSWKLCQRRVRNLIANLTWNPWLLSETRFRICRASIPKPWTLWISAPPNKSYKHCNSQRSLKTPIS